MSFRDKVAALKAKYSPAVFSLLAASAAQAFCPPPALTVSEWADAHRVVTAPSPELGPWKTSRTPYLKEIMDVCSPNHPARIIDLQKATQIGGTEVAVNVIGYYSDVYPQPGMVVLPSKDVAKEWAEFRFAGLFESTHQLGRLLGERHNRRSRASKNTTLLKRLTNGGSWKFAWSSSGKTLRSTPAAILVADEVDGFDIRAGHEGEPVELLANRNSNFDRGKYLRLSSPAHKPIVGSRIERGFKAGDQRYYFVPCPHCKWFQRLVWEQIEWPEGTEENREERTAAAQYKCIHCSKLIPEWHKTDMLNAGMWVATKYEPNLAKVGFDPDKLPSMRPLFRSMEEAKHVSFHLNALYAPLGWPDQAWRALAAKYEAVVDTPESLKAFVMTKLAEVWIEEGATPEETKLFARCEPYTVGVLPSQCCFATAFVDVQGDRLEYEIVGWDEKCGRWSVKYEAINGKTNEPAVWARLEKVLAEPIPTADGGHMPLLAMGIDTGHEAAQVYEFARRHPQMEKTNYGYMIKHPRTVVCTKGASDKSFDKLIVRATTDDGAIRKRGGIVLIWIGTGFAKVNIFARLKLPKPGLGETTPPNFYHFPVGFEIDPYFNGLCSERLITDGTGKRKFEVITGRRNEILDIATGNWAVAALTRFDRVPAVALVALRSRLVSFGQLPGGPAPAQQQRAPRRGTYSNPNLG